jgi:hypothetical protein
MRPNRDEIYNQSKPKIKELVLMCLAEDGQPPYIETVALRYGMPRHAAARILIEIKKEIGYDQRTKNRSY